jgi:DNA-binding MarR family transcriptional regulator
MRAMDTRKPPANSRTNSRSGAKAPALDARGAMLLLDNQLCFALYSASLTMTKVYKPLLKDLELTYPQYLVLLVLWERDGVTVSELGERLYLDSGTLTPLLKRMEGMQLLRRERSTEDERQVQVNLTPAGRALRKRALPVPEQLLCAAQCSTAEIVGLTRRLQALRGALAQSVPG